MSPSPDLKTTVAHGHLLKIIAIILLASSIMANTVRADVDFDYLHGSDLGIGIGARAISMSGAFTAVADDASAVFWNPAGLAQLADNQAFLSGDYPGGFSSAGLVYLPRAKSFKNLQMAFGLALVNRLRFKGDSGEEIWDEYASNLLSLAMVDIDEEYAGTIDSRTMDIRFSLALQPLSSKRFLVGFNYIHLD